MRIYAKRGAKCNDNVQGKVLALLAKNLEIDAIVERVGCTRQTVYKVIRKTKDAQPHA